MTINTNVWNRIRYTLWAPIYDRIAAFPTYRRRSIELLRPLPGEEVLIVGAGTGADLPHLPPGISLTAIDLTPAMLDRLRERAQALGRPVDARVMDGQALDLPAARFDAVILHLILAVIPDPVACIREVERVLKPGGRAVIFDKFVPDDEAPGLGRRVGNVFANLLFSDITRKLGPIVAHTSLIIERTETAKIAGVPYQTVILRRLATA
ncbi:MAG: phosphatidylethanolamine N-methyltransferase [Symbiobacteriaceae bacterium]|jgi:ubiquinone/menaquinone biosynthesis C-methylase UbiE|nr:phosphatidylethanolamine N-methyltransferase [Symbiobacteriaceae bacterium]